MRAVRRPTPTGASHAFMDEIHANRAMLTASFSSDNSSCDVPSLHSLFWSVRRRRRPVGTVVWPVPGSLTDSARQRLLFTAHTIPFSPQMSLPRLSGVDGTAHAGLSPRHP